MSWQRVASTSDLSDGEAFLVVVGDRKIALAQDSGRYFAVDDTCTHEEESLSDGFVENCTIECPRHGALFDLQTGDAKTLPATQGLTAYPVKIDNYDIYIDM